jgi:hypothetical protein
MPSPLSKLRCLTPRTKLTLLGIQNPKPLRSRSHELGTQNRRRSANIQTINPNIKLIDARRDLHKRISLFRDSPIQTLLFSPDGEDDGVART